MHRMFGRSHSVAQSQFQNETMDNDFDDLIDKHLNFDLNCLPTSLCDNWITASEKIKRECGSDQ
jgi:hypothetical protein